MMKGIQAIRLVLAVAMTALALASVGPATADTRDGLQQIAGVRTVPKFIEPPLECSCPCWSPGGEYVMFVGRPTEQAGGNVSSGWVPGNVWIVSSDGSKRWLLSNFFFGNLQPPPGRKANPLKLDVLAAAWSPDGQQIAFTACEDERTPSLYVMKADGTDIHRVAKDIDSHRISCHPRWSADGKSLIFEHGGSIATDIDGSVFTSLGRRGKGLFGEMRMFETLPNIREGAEGIVPTLYLEHACMGADNRILAVGYAPQKIAAGAPAQKNEGSAGICVVSRNWAQIKWVLKAPIQKVFSLAWSPDQKNVCTDCADYHPYVRELYVLNIASGKQTRLTEGITPSWSPNGKQIAFEGGGGDGTGESAPGLGDIYVIDSDGKNLHRITNLTPPGVCRISGSKPCWSPDGKSIVFRRGPYVSTVQPAGVYPRGQEIWTANRDGTGQRCLVKSGDLSRVDNTGTMRGPFEYLPFWRADGRIVFPAFKARTAWGPTISNPLAGPAKDGQPGFEVSTVSADGADIRPLMVLKSPAEGDEICWSPNGSRIAFDKDQNIYVAKGDGTEQKRLIGGRHPRWSPDGEKILYVQGSEHNEVLCIINADGSNQPQITEPGDGYEAYHCWCPDGKKIAFQGKYGLWVVSVQGGDAHRLVPGVSQPCWSPDGRQMAFVVHARPVELPAAVCLSSVYVMNADGSGIRPVIQVGKTAYGDNLVNNLSWSPDGKHILFEETAKKGYDYQNLHHIWIVDVSEPVFYQASYVASELLPWKTP